MSQHRSISIAEQVFEQLERDILSGKYPKGEILSEMRLSTELGVSRTPIREAIRRLEQEHLVELGGKGIIVVGITKEDMKDMYEIRISLEGTAAARAAMNITNEQLAELREILDLQEYYIMRPHADSSNDSDHIKNLDSRFHELIYTSCGSKAYLDTLLPMHKKMTKFRKASVRKQSRARQSLEEHRAVLHALEKRDRELACKLMVEHTVNARNSIMNMEE